MALFFAYELFYNKINNNDKLNHEWFCHSLIRIALLRRQTLAETLEMLKTALFDWRSMKTAVWIKLEDRAFALFSRPHSGALGSLSVPAPGNLPSKTKKS